LLIPDLGFEVETAVEKLERFKSLGTDHILAGLIQAGGKNILKSANILILME
jgi:hypothetical protein